MFSKQSKQDESGRLIQAIAIAGFIIMLLADQQIDPKVNIPDWAYVTIAAVAVGATKAAKKFVERLFGTDK